ncbi:hypothetical protein [Yersinia sp. Marseille-Q3913]|uniref:hypothetical protein n=1 Tax=Yersinia sp. Marseille-Q3913 TaxID=2830769 RepID=UPI001BAE7026|nr:hypothetical protein [Yersinia sp. Marseille-Q3913]MBS0055581.1 hypothetical protein [Yersinia sp. Marseille-Q3913]
MDYHFENEYNNTSLDQEVAEEIELIGKDTYIAGAHQADYSPDYISKSYKVSDKIANLMHRHNVYGKSAVAALCILEKLRVDDHSLEYVAKENNEFDMSDFIKMVKCGVKDIETYYFYKEILLYKKAVNKWMVKLLEPKNDFSYKDEQSYLIKKYPQYRNLIDAVSSKGEVRIQELASLIVLGSHKLPDGLLTLAKGKILEMINLSPQLSL